MGVDVAFQGVLGHGDGVADIPKSMEHTFSRQGILSYVRKMHSLIVYGSSDVLDSMALVKLEDRISWFICTSSIYKFVRLYMSSSKGRTICPFSCK
jgi:hypothetical protein